MIVANAFVILAIIVLVLLGIVWLSENVTIKKRPRKK